MVSNYLIEEYIASELSEAQMSVVNQGIQEGLINDYESAFLIIDRIDTTGFDYYDIVEYANENNLGQYIDRFLLVYNQQVTYGETWEETNKQYGIEESFRSQGNMYGMWSAFSFDDVVEEIIPDNTNQLEEIIPEDQLNDAFVDGINSNKLSGGIDGEEVVSTIDDVIIEGAGETVATSADDLVDLTDFRSEHILNRHKNGAGVADKTEFPADWT